MRGNEKRIEEKEREVEREREEKEEKRIHHTLDFFWLKQHTHELSH